MKLVPHSLRWRLQLWHGLLLLIVLCAFGFTALHLEKAELLRILDNDLQHRLSALVNAMRAPQGTTDRRGQGEPAHRPPPPRQSGEPPRPNLDFAPEVAALFGERTGFYYAVWMRGSEPIAHSVNAPADLPRPLSGDNVVRTRGGDLRETFLFAAPADCVLVGRSMARVREQLSLQPVALIGAGGVLLVLGVLVGAWLVGRAIRPVEDIGRTAERIANGDLTQRINTSGTDDELGRLAGVLNMTFARLDAAFTQQARFTADAAHELRTPITVMLSETQATLARERTTPEYRESLEACQRAAQRMRRLIERLLELARIEAGQEALRREPCDLAAVSAQCIEQLQPLAREGSVVMHHALAACPCRADAERLAQVTTNLLANAIQHSTEGGEVRISTAVKGGMVTLAVADHGPGISPEDLPHIFERFYRADKARTASTGRAGLGLSIAKAIITAHGGTIEVQSEEGHGATFRVQLPTGD